ncbi:multidrug efflux SMR transporter [Kineosporia sp. NBRC 101731]|uniref:DMT family transporter n=1 Tax=Kineosporia sp. NBRC 101731 TaxID=3032199 RepID=UPI0025553575|nr:multidrug efflux SMR transporter [Kineosporia sp. NBRC 101731]
MAWLALAGAIVLEIMATISLKTADGFTRFWPSVIVVVGYIGCFSLLGFALKTLDVGLVYALWSAVGTAAITLLAVVMFGETITLPRIGGLLLIILGVIVVNLSGGEAHAVGGTKVSTAPAPVPPVPQQRVQGPESGEVPMLTPRSGLIPRQMRPRHDMKTDPDSDLAPVFPDLRRPEI